MDNARKQVIQAKKQYQAARNTYDTTRAGLKELAETRAKLRNEKDTPPMELRKVNSRIEQGIENHIKALQAWKGEDPERDKKTRRKLLQIVRDAA